MELNQWDTVKNLRPKLANHIQLQPRQFKNERWFVLHDELNQKFHRLNSEAYALIKRLQGRSSIEESVAAANHDGSNISERDAVQLLQYLHASDLLICEAPPSTEDINTRKQALKKNPLKQLIKSPYIWRVPLGNPDPWLDRIAPKFRWMGAPLMGYLWLFVVFYALLNAFEHWPTLSSQSLHEVFSPENLLILWLTYPILKIFHELGHALFTKIWGGRVTEFGVVFILGTPLPYVDATTATGFHSKRRRLMVSAAGMAVELFLASFALFIWLQTEPGLVKTLLFNIMLIGSVSTLFFNGNPLMRFDGYYLLTDLLDAPNIAPRAQKYLGYLLKFRLLGIPCSAPYISSRKNAFALGGYGIAALCYRFFIIGTIILIAATLHPSLAIALAIWIGIAQLGVPLLYWLRYLWLSPDLFSNRLTPNLRFAFITGLVVTALFFVPIPHSTTTEGVVWIPDDARVRTEGGGIVIQTHVKNGATVKKGQLLISISNPDLKADLSTQKLMLKIHETQYQSAWLESRTEVQKYAKEIEVTKAHIQYLTTQIASLQVLAPSSGTYRSLKKYRLLGSYLTQGEVFGIITYDSSPQVRAVLSQDQINLVQAHTNKIEVMLASLQPYKWLGTVLQDVPNATFTLPSAALGTAGGGNTVISREDSKHMQAIDQIFVTDISIQPPTALASLNTLKQHTLFGERAYVRFEHKAAPAAWQVYRAARQLIKKIQSQQIDLQELTHR